MTIYPRIYVASLADYKMLDMIRTRAEMEAHNGD